MALDCRGPESSKLLLGRRALIIVRALYRILCSYIDGNAGHRTRSMIPGRLFSARLFLLLDPPSPSYSHRKSLRDFLVCIVTHRYAVSELQKDVEKELLALPESEREASRTQFAVFGSYPYLPLLISLCLFTTLYLLRCSCSQQAETEARRNSCRCPVSLCLLWRSRSLRPRRRLLCSWERVILICAWGWTSRYYVGDEVDDVW